MLEPAYMFVGCAKTCPAVRRTGSRANPKEACFKLRLNSLLVDWDPAQPQQVTANG